jgi:predicted transcriptional regulator of viral defense system
MAGRQHGIVKRKQVREAGLSRREIERRLEAGWLVRLYDGVYAVGHTALTDKSHLIAAVYACGPAALAGYRSAGALWAVLRRPQRIEVTAPRGRKPKRGMTVHRSRCIHEEDRAVIDNIPVTSWPAPSSTSPTSSRRSSWPTPFTRPRCNGSST